MARHSRSCRRSTCPRARTTAGSATPTERSTCSRATSRFYALVGHQVSTKLAMRIITVRRLWLEHRVVRRGADVADRARARDRLLRRARRLDRAGSDDQDSDPPRRRDDPARAAADHEARPLQAADARGRPRPGRQPHREDPLPRDEARLAGLAGRRATGRGRARRPRRSARSARRSGGGFVVEPVSDAALYDVVDTNYRTAAAVVVVDLAHDPGVHARRAARASARGEDRRHSARLPRAPARTGASASAPCCRGARRRRSSRRPRSRSFARRPGARAARRGRPACSRRARR